jgi:hypothetical protein
MRAAFSWARQTARVLQPLAPRFETAAGHPAACTSMPQGNGRQALRSGKTPGLQLLLGEVRCRQPEKIFLSSEVTDLSPCGALPVLPSHRR